MKVNIAGIQGHQIKAIIFDLGAVILNIDYQLTKIAFENLGVSDFNDLFSKARQNTLFDFFEKGLISPGEFRQNLRDLTGINLSDRQIDEAWNAMLLDLPLQRVELLQNLKNHFRLFLLSNTNQIHITAFKEYIHKLCGWHNFAGCFEKMYLSSEVKMRKPDAEIFLSVLNENNLTASQTLFIDDSPQHIEGAKKLSVIAYHLKDDTDINSLFSPL